MIERPVERLPGSAGNGDPRSDRDERGGREPDRGRWSSTVPRLAPRTPSGHDPFSGSPLECCRRVGDMMRAEPASVAGDFYAPYFITAQQYNKR